VPTAPRTSAGTAIGVDIGGSGIKGAPVDLESGEFAAERVRIDTPQPATPDAVAPIVAEIVEQCGDAPIGVAFPAVVQHGVARTAANVDESWIGTDVQALLREATGRDVLVVNDADAAGLAEARWGAAKGHPGVVIVTTLGTGIGSALLLDGKLVPNTELGHLEIDGHDAETRAAESARDREDLSWEQWAKRLQRYYSVVENLFWPDLFVVGGGISKKHAKFLPLLDLRTPIVPAELRNAAGIVGAAALAADGQDEFSRQRAS
jgi:polyphosphate glucokinase